MQLAGVRSGRQRRNVEPWRKRPSWSWPNVTSATRSMRRGTHDRSLPAFQRLAPPGIRCSDWAWIIASAQSRHGWPSSASWVSGSTSASSSVRRLTLKPATTPTWCRTPSPSYRPSSSEPTPLAVLVDPVAGHHAVGGATVLDLDEGALVGCVRIGEALGDDAVETGTLELDEPAAGDVDVGRARAEVDGHAGRDPQLGDQPLVTGGERGVEQHLVADRQQVEGHERRRRLGGEPVDARHGRMDALQQRVEVEAAVVAGRARRSRRRPRSAAAARRAADPAAPGSSG